MGPRPVGRVLPQQRQHLFGGPVLQEAEEPDLQPAGVHTTFAACPLTSLTQPLNADSGRLLGVEVNLQTRFTFLPAPFDSFGASVNGTLVDSEVKVPGRLQEDIPFFTQSDKILNAPRCSSSARPFEARVAVSYRDDFIVFVGTTADNDIYQLARTVVDARMSYKLSDASKCSARCPTSTTRPNSFYQSTRNRTYAREIYSYNADFGVEPAV
jgi:hypothetical protein